IFVGPQAQQVLLRYLARSEEVYCFRPIDSEEKRRAKQHAHRKTPLSCGNKPGSNRKAKPKLSAGVRYDTNTYRRVFATGGQLCWSVWSSPADSSGQPPSHTSSSGPGAARGPHPPAASRGKPRLLLPTRLLSPTFFSTHDLP